MTLEGSGGGVESSIVVPAITREPIVIVPKPLPVEVLIGYLSDLDKLNRFASNDSERLDSEEIELVNDYKQHFKKALIELYTPPSTIVLTHNQAIIIVKELFPSCDNETMSKLVSCLAKLVSLLNKANTGSMRIRYEHLGDTVFPSYFFNLTPDDEDTIQKLPDFWKIAFSDNPYNQIPTDLGNEMRAKLVNLIDKVRSLRHNMIRLFYHVLRANGLTLRDFKRIYVNPTNNYLDVRGRNLELSSTELTSTLTEGRSISVMLTDRNLPEPMRSQFISLLKAILPGSNEERIKSLLATPGIKLKIKGLGPTLSTYGSSSVLSIEHFVQRHSITGYTGLDKMDIEVAQLLTGEHEVEDLFGLDDRESDSSDGSSIRKYHYYPSRLFVLGLPISDIILTDGVVSPHEWEEPLYCEFFLEIGGENAEDIFCFIKQNNERFGSTTVDGILELELYLRSVAQIHPIFSDLNIHDLSEDTTNKFWRRLVAKHWYDSWIEAQYLRFGTNRSLQNFTLGGGNQDLDDTEFLEGMMVLPTEQRIQNAIRIFLDKLTKILDILKQLFYGRSNHFSSILTSLNGIITQIVKKLISLDSNRNYTVLNIVLINKVYDFIYEAKEFIQNNISSLYYDFFSHICRRIINAQSEEDKNRMINILYIPFSRLFNQNISIQQREEMAGILFGILKDLNLECTVQTRIIELLIGFIGYFKRSGLQTHILEYFNHAESRCPEITTTIENYKTDKEKLEKKN